RHWPGYEPPADRTNFRALPIWLRRRNGTGIGDCLSDRTGTRRQGMGAVQRGTGDDIRAAVETQRRGSPGVAAATSPDRLSLVNRRGRCTRRYAWLTSSFATTNAPYAKCSTSHSAAKVTRSKRSLREKRLRRKLMGPSMTSS